MFMMKERKSSKGFTLVELIVVIAIIAVLAVAAVVAYSNIADQAEEAAVRSDANTVIRALNTYNALVYVDSTGTVPDRRITTIAGVTESDLQQLALSTDKNDSVNMKLGVAITGDRLAKVIEIIKYDLDDPSSTTRGSDMWILNLTTTTTTT